MLVLSRSSSRTPPEQLAPHVLVPRATGHSPRLLTKPLASRRRLRACPYTLSPSRATGSPASIQRAAAGARTRQSPRTPAVAPTSARPRQARGRVVAAARALQLRPHSAPPRRRQTRAPASALSAERLRTRQLTPRAAPTPAARPVLPWRLVRQHAVARGCSPYRTSPHAPCPCCLLLDRTPLLWLLSPRPPRLELGNALDGCSPCGARPQGPRSHRRSADAPLSGALLRAALACVALRRAPRSSSSGNLVVALVTTECMG